MVIPLFEPDEDDVVYIEVRRDDEPLPGWLDLLLCVVAPTIVAISIVFVFALAR